MTPETTETVLLILTLAFGFYMAWSIGANDVANAMGTSVGSGALTLKKAVIFAGILECAGAVLVGMHVSETVRQGIVNVEIFADRPMFLVYGMIAALLAAAVWLQVASYYGWPVSTTHSIIGAIIGFGAVVGGVSAVDWPEVGTIVSSWVISPLLSGIIAFFIFSILRRQIFYSRYPVRMAKKVTPYLVFFVFSILTLVLVFKGLKNLNFDLSLAHSLLLAMGVGLLAAFISHLLVKKIREDDGEKEISKKIELPQVAMGLSRAERSLKRAMFSSGPEVKEKVEKLLEEVRVLRQSAMEKTDMEETEVTAYKRVERIFVYLQILSACFVAFAHGANDVANAIGPLSAVLHVLNTGVVEMKAPVPMWVLAFGGIGIVIGLATWGWRVIETIGKRITELTPTRGFSAEFAAAVTIVLASKLGIPVSTTHTLVGAVLGVGFARGLGALNLSIIRDIVISWVITLPIGAILAIGFFYALLGIFG